jgi:hypothetical protein
VTDLAEMWAHLEAHQSFADERGYGLEWKRMCAKRTPRAAKWVAEVLAATDAADAAWAARAAAAAVDASWDAAAAAWAAIGHINKAREPKP